MNNMLKSIRKQFPDTKVQKLEMKEIISRYELEKTVMAFSKALDFGTVGFQSYGLWVHVYTSETFKAKLATMKKGDTVLDSLVGQVGMIESEEPFLCGGEMSIRVSFGNYSEVYNCRYFMLWQDL